MTETRTSTAVTLLIGATIGWLATSYPLFPTTAAQNAVLDNQVDAEEPSVQPVVADDGPEQQVPEQQLVERPLETLDWLVGSWVDDPASPGIEFSCQFTKNNAFMVRSFKTDTENDAMSGMQVVAWDPAVETIRSWTFDSDGGFGEDRWSQADDRYTIRTKYTLPDGGVAASLNVMTYVDEDTFTWKSVNREINGVLQPDTDQITLQRVVVAASQTRPETDESTEPNSGVDQ